MSHTQGFVMDSPDLPKSDLPAGGDDGLKYGPTEVSRYDERGASALVSDTDDRDSGVVLDERGENGPSTSPPANVSWSDAPASKDNCPTSLMTGPPSHSASTHDILSSSERERATSSVATAPPVTQQSLAPSQIQPTPVLHVPHGSLTVALPQSAAQTSPLLSSLPPMPTAPAQHQQNAMFVANVPPIHRIPVETLEEILLAVLDEVLYKPTLMGHDIQDCHAKGNSLFSLRIVCRRWDTLIRNSASFWTRSTLPLPLVTRIPLREATQTFSELAHRVKGAGLSLTLQVRQAYGLGFAQPGGTNPNNSYNAASFEDVIMPLLGPLYGKTDALYLYGNGLSTAPTPRPICMRCPPIWNTDSLRMLVLYHIEFKSGHYNPDHADWFPSSVLELLIATPNLETLRIVGSTNIVPNDGVDLSLPLHKLKTLEYASKVQCRDLERLFTRVSMPVVEHIHLAAPFHTFLLPQSVRSLQIGPRWTGYSVRDIVRGLGQLTHLTIDGLKSQPPTPSSRVKHYLALGEILTELLLPVDGRRALALSLHSLTLLHCKPTVQSLRKFADLWIAVHPRQLAIHSCYIDGPKTNSSEAKRPDLVAGRMAQKGISYEYKSDCTGCWDLFGPHFRSMSTGNGC